MGRLWLLATLGCLLQQQPPTFRSGVDLIVVDVTVVTSRGVPVLDLTPADFEVHVGGSRRDVKTVELLQYGFGPSRTSDAPPTSLSPKPLAERRLFILAIDEHSLHVSNALAAVRAAEQFIDKLDPTDLVGLYPYPTSRVRIPPTSDHWMVRAALQKVTGLAMGKIGRFNMSPAEAVDIMNGDSTTFSLVLRRECPTVSFNCGPSDIRTDAHMVANYVSMQGSQSIAGLRAVVDELRDVHGRKTVVIVSGGLISSDRAGGASDLSAEISYLARTVAINNISIFALHLDWSFIVANGTRQGLQPTIFRDGNLAATGLERIAGSTGGSVARVYGTDPQRAFDRVLNETSAIYVVGVTSRQEDHDGHPKGIRVKVKRRGLQVHHRQLVVVPRPR